MPVTKTASGRENQLFLTVVTRFRFRFGLLALGAHQELDTFLKGPHELISGGYQLGYRPHDCNLQLRMEKE